MKIQHTLIDCPIVDSHCHIYPEKIALKAVAGIGAFYDIPMNYDGRSATLLEKQKEGGITHAMIFSVATKPAQVGSINRFIANEVANSDGLWTGLGTMHPESENKAADMAELRSLGLVGVKLHPDVQGFAINDPRCMEIYELCTQENIPVLLHTGDNRYSFSNPDQLIPVLEAFPHLTVIAAHLGGYSVWDEAAEKLARFDNVFVDSSSSLFAMTPEHAAELIHRYGTERVLFATDYPMWDAVTEINRFTAIPLTAEERERILWKNAKALFGLDRVE